MSRESAEAAGQQETWFSRSFWEPLSAGAIHQPDRVSRWTWGRGHKTRRKRAAPDAEVTDAKGEQTP